MLRDFVAYLAVARAKKFDALPGARFAPGIGVARAVFAKGAQLKKSILGWVFATALALASSTALATFHTFVIQELYSNAGGTVQYIVLQEAQGMDGQDLFKTHGMQRTAGDGSQFLSFPFPKNLPGPSTARKFVLIGTQSFAALGLVTPDYVMPDGFMLITNGVMNFAGVDEIDYAALPTDGINALYRDGSIRPNLATNFNGNTASVGATSAAPNYQGLWFNPAESGWGINFAHQGDIIFASWFTYDLTGKGTWLVMTAAKTTPGTYTGQLFQGTGPAFDAVPFPPLGSPGGATVSGLGGTGTITFSDADNATFAYTLAGISQTKSIKRQLLGPGSPPVCTFGGQKSSNRGHMGIDGVIQMADELRRRGVVTDATKLVATHFSHNGGLLYEELADAFLPHGILVAYDGIVIRA